MPVQLVTLPESSALTMGGRMIFQFQGSGRTITTGTKAVCVLIVTGPVPDGYSRKISWKGQTETIVFKSAPLEPNEFPAGDGSPAYVDQLAEQLAEYFPFYNDYVVERSNDATTPGIKFSAREPGTKYTFSLDAQPESAPITFGFSFVTVDGADPLLRTEYSIYGELWVQKDQTEGLTQADFRKVAPVTIRTDASGLARWDVGAMLHAELTPDSPNWTLPIAKRAFNSHKKYFIRYAEAWGSPIRNARVKTDVTRNAYLGGVSYEEKASGGFQLTNYVKLGTPAQDQALRYGSKTRYVRIDEPQFLTFINLRASLKASLEVSLKFSDGSTLVLMDQIPPFDFGTSEKWSMPVGIDQLGLLAKVPAGKSLVEYQVRLCQTSTVNYLSAPYRYIVNGRHEPYTRYFAFVNSLGAIDTLPTFGKGSSELTRYFEQADRFLPAFYPVEHGQLIDHNISVQQQLEVSTGFCSQKELDRWLDFYLSPTRYHLVEDKALPISISSKTIKEAKDGDTTFSNVFQFVYLFRDDFYTYAGDPDLEGDGEPPLGFVPGGNVTITVPQVVYAVDNTVPNVVRQFTPELFSQFLQVASRPNPETQGFLKQASADALYRPKGVKIDYQKDLINTPAVPEVVIPSLQVVTTEGGNITNRAISTAGYIRSTTPADIDNGSGVAMWSPNAPAQNALEMSSQLKFRKWLGREADLVTPWKQPFEQADGMAGWFTIGDEQLVVKLSYDYTLQQQAMKALGTTLNYLGLQIAKNGTDEFFQLICAGLKRIQCSTATGTLELSDDVIKEIAKRIGFVGPGGVPILVAGTPVFSFEDGYYEEVSDVVASASINFILVQLDDAGFTPVANASATAINMLETRLGGINGTIYNNTAWYKAALFDGTLSSGSFRYLGYGLLPPGWYESQWQVVGNTNPNAVFRKTFQVLATGCTRPTSGLRTFTFCWNFTPTGGTTAERLTWDNSDRIVVKNYNSSAPGRFSTFFGQIPGSGFAAGLDTFYEIKADCQKIENAVYYLLSNTGDNTVGIIIAVEAGKIKRSKTPAYVEQQDPQLVGSFEELSPGLVKGWCFDQRNPGRKILLDILVDEVPVSQVETGIARPDVASGTGVAAATNAGFQFNIPAGHVIINGQFHSVLVRDNQTGWVLTNSPRTINARPANRAPVLVGPMPDVAITTADEYVFALGDVMFTDPDGDVIATTVSQGDGTALPSWLTYLPGTRQFKKAQGVTSGSVPVRVRGTDPGGLFADDHFLVTVSVNAVPRTIQSIDFEYVTQNGSSYLLWYVATNFGVDGLQMAISWPTDPTYGAQEPGQWITSASATDPTYRIIRDAPVAITAHFRDTNSGAPEISFTVNRPANIRSNAARTRVYTAP